MAKKWTRKERAAVQMREGEAPISSEDVGKRNSAQLWNWMEYERAQKNISNWGGTVGLVMYVILYTRILIRGNVSGETEFMTLFISAWNARSMTWLFFLSALTIKD